MLTVVFCVCIGQQVQYYSEEAITNNSSRVADLFCPNKTYNIVILITMPNTLRAAMIELQ